MALQQITVMQRRYMGDIVYCANVGVTWHTHRYSAGTMTEIIRQLRADGHLDQPYESFVNLVAGIFRPSTEEEWAIVVLSSP